MSMVKNMDYDETDFVNPERIPLRMPEDRKKKIQHADVSWFRRKRYYVIFLLILNQMVLYWQGNNFILALVDMSSDKTVEIGNQSFVQKSEFQWNSVEISFILSSGIIGNILTPLVGIFIHKYGGAAVIAVMIFFTGGLSILTPLTMHCSMPVLIILRILAGTSTGLQLVSVMDIIMHWTPPNERSIMITTAYDGMFLGSAISDPLCGFTIKKFGWATSFYIVGGVSLLWACIWSLLIHNDPANDRLISDKEKKYLSEKIHISFDKNLSYPWKSILTSKAVWVLMNERFVESWSQSFATIILPFYIKDVQNLSIEGISLISSLPYWATFFGILLGSIAADYFRNHDILNISTVHKIYIALGQITTIISLILISLLKNFTATIILLSILRFSYGITNTSYLVLPADIASIYGSCVTGLCIAAFYVGSLLNPVIVEYVVPNHTPLEWYRYLIFLCAFNVWGIIAFYFFGTGELQPWAMSPEKENSNQKKDASPKV